MIEKRYHVSFEKWPRIMAERDCIDEILIEVETEDDLREAAFRFYNVPGIHHPFCRFEVFGDCMGIIAQMGEVFNDLEAVDKKRGHLTRAQLIEILRQSGFTEGE